MSKRQRKRIVIRDDAGNITFDSDAVQKSILKVTDSPSFSINHGIISPQSRWVKETVILLKKHGEMKFVDYYKSPNDKLCNL